RHGLARHRRRRNADRRDRHRLLGVGRVEQPVDPAHPGRDRDHRCGGAPARAVAPVAGTTPWPRGRLIPHEEHEMILDAIPVRPVVGTAARPIIEIESAGMGFPGRGGARGGFVALREIDLRVAPGEFVTLIGHSGCGKSTLLNLLAGLLLPTEGVVLCNGREVSVPGPDRAVVFLNHSLLPWLTCHGNVMLAVEQVFGATERGAELLRRVDAALAMVRMS